MTTNNKNIFLLKSSPLYIYTLTSAYFDIPIDQLKEEHIKQITDLIEKRGFYYFFDMINHYEIKISEYCEGSIGSYIEFFVKGKNLKNRELAEILGIKPPILANLKNDKISKDSKTYKKTLLKLQALKQIISDLKIDQFSRYQITSKIKERECFRKRMMESFFKDKPQQLQTFYELLDMLDCIDSKHKKIWYDGVLLLTRYMIRTQCYEELSEPEHFFSKLEENVIKGESLEYQENLSRIWGNIATVYSRYYENKRFMKDNEKIVAKTSAFYYKAISYEITEKLYFDIIYNLFTFSNKFGEMKTAQEFLDSAIRKYGEKAFYCQFQKEFTQNDVWLGLKSFGIFDIILKFLTKGE